MHPAEDRAVQLARRLRSLRTEGFAGRRVTQAELAAALGASVPLVSSWESRTAPSLPAQDRLDSYATFFATERSVAQAPFRVLPPSELTSEERARREELLGELTALRAEARVNASGHSADPFAGSFWRLPAEEDITIVCSEVPSTYLASMPYANPHVPDHVALYRYADLDALVELYGHLRAVNALSNVHIRTSGQLGGDAHRGHLVLLGGVDWNATTGEFLRRLDIPVRQLARENEVDPGGFVVGEDQRLFQPVLRKVDDNEILVEDVAHFLRGPNPFNDRHTLTICSGMYARGTFGAVRALTDAHLRHRNEDYLRTRFAGANAFSILSRVRVFAGAVVTPHWASSEDLLHEWPVHL